MPRRLSSRLQIAILIAISPLTVDSFGWLELDSLLSDRLMGVRPEWTIAANSRYRNNHYPQSNCAFPSIQSARLSSRQQSTKQDQAEMWQFMNAQPNFLGASDLDPLAPLDSDTVDLLHCIVRAADGRKAHDICALKVHHITTLTSVLVILSGNSRPQNQAIAAAITKDVQEHLGQRPGGGPNGIPEGSAESGWMLLDYGTVMVHIMTPKSRLFYNVQGQWKQKGALEIDLTHIVIPNTVPTPSSSTISEQDNTWTTDTASQQPLTDKDEDDPFWS